MGLKNWLKENHINIHDFASLVGVTRQTIHLVMNGKSVCEDTSQKIYFHTKGRVKVPSIKRGRPKKKDVNISTKDILSDINDNREGK